MPSVDSFTVKLTSDLSPRKIRCSRGSASARLGAWVRGGFGHVDLDVLQERRSVDVFGPLVLLVVGAEDDALAFAQGIGQKGVGLAKGGQVGTALEGGSQGLQLLPRLLPVVGKARQHPRLAGQFDDRDLDLGTGPGSISFCDAISRPRMKPSSAWWLRVLSRM